MYEVILYYYDGWKRVYGNEHGVFWENIQRKCSWSIEKTYEDAMKEAAKFDGSGHNHCRASINSL